MQRRLCLIFLLLPLFAPAQTVHLPEVLWASKVLGFSSERTDNVNQGPQYRAIQVLGKPNKLPQKGESVCAWSSAGADTFGEEWIKVSFAKSLKIKQIGIAENFNPGAVTKIFAYDSTGKEYLIYENKEPAPKEIGRMWDVIIPPTEYAVSSLKVVLEPAKVRGFNQIDAIAISDSETPIEAKINLAVNLPKEIEKENLGKGVNSKADEVAPIITSDGKTLFFTREGHEGNMGKKQKQDIWMSKLKSDGTWEEAQNIGKPINNDENNAATGISADAKTLYVLNVYLPDGSFRLGLSKSKRNRLGWDFPKEMKIEDYYNNYNFNENSYAEFTLAPSGKAMVIACQRNDSHGDKDLYVSFPKKDGGWSKPLNMGKQINSAENESAPFIAADSKTLYFSSDGFSGYGNGDIFVAKRLDSTWTNWSEPENLGPLINSPKWDGYFSIPASGEYAYLSSGEKSFGYQDIFRIKLFPSIKPDPVAIISGTVVNSVDRKPLAADIVVEMLNDTLTEKTTAEFDPETGEYKLVVPLKKIYSLNASKKGFLGLSETIDLQKETKFREIRENIVLVPIKEGTTIILHNLFFEQSKFDILPASHPELARIIALMKEYPTMEVLLEGHTDNQGDMLLNVKLSENRVAEVKKYLVEKGGIDEKRIQLKGWGQTRPIGSNITEETRKKNRRVEFTIVKL